ncbi:hypothetical protein VL20_4117 [Microcystis panniformis FACHB-1757]|uniref:Uncharacterized protein n=1 Tax=Microcystis panniformis FACHB-1757 TaxID=1638788 RepID=A0A0K1S4Y5_9CHRO|nr:hypothetical protein VL20_4117 [Microcystis panniformis FACHB-1757]
MTIDLFLILCGTTTNISYQLSVISYQFSVNCLLITDY